MAMGRRKENWTHTAHVLAMLHNTTRASKDDCRPVEDFLPEPFRPPRRDRPGPKIRVADLKNLFCK